MAGGVPDVDDASTRQVFDLDGDVVVAFAVDPRPHPAVWAFPVEMVGELIGAPDGQHAPTAVVERVELVDLEGDHGVAHGGVELGALAGAEDDPTPVQGEVDREHGRQGSDRDRHPPERDGAEQMQALVLAEDLQALVAPEIALPLHKSEGGASVGGGQEDKVTSPQRPGL